MPAKRSKNLRLGIYLTQIRRREHNVVAIQVSDLILQDNRTVDTASDWLIWVQ